jgi:hypothetical protein
MTLKPVSLEETLSSTEELVVLFVFDVIHLPRGSRVAKKVLGQRGLSFIDLVKQWGGGILADEQGVQYHLIESKI